ncbi:MAG: VWA domain-containing protein [Terriglobales bacterium]|jgi:VWFA-related protein
MKVRVILLFIGSAFVLMTAAHAQQPSPADLPSAPSASQPGSQPAKPAASPPQTATDQQQTQSQAPPATSGSKSEAGVAAASQSQPAPSPQAEGTAPPTAAAPADDSAPTIVKRVNEVNVVFTVTDKHGRYVRDLKKNDFKIIDDSKPVLEIRSFRAETDLPLEAGLLIDASNSIRDRFKFEQEAAIEFLNQTVRRKYDRAFVVGFDATPEVTQDFTDSTEALSVGVRALRPGGGTALFDALYFACRDKLLKSSPNGAVRRTIILLSDGDDNQSHVTREEAIEMAERAEVVVYTISTNLTGSGGKHGDKILERIAEATGGRSYVPFQLTEVANAFASIQEELRSQYAISYKPADFRTDGRFRTIEIEARQKGLHVRSRRGYYAPAQ